jgi:hypothetical protein
MEVIETLSELEENSECDEKDEDCGRKSDEIKGNKLLFLI